MPRGLQWKTKTAQLKGLFSSFGLLVEKNSTLTEQKVIYEDYYVP